ncbi:MAG: hypothetical protein HY255_02375 [Betaproteobacteria bacterium]|nr:hypothetical protein [Betaproteobacteria bacterium]
MRKIFLLSLFALPVIAFPAFAANSAGKSSVELCNEMNAATFSGNAERTVELTYPKLIEMVGRERMIGMIRQAALPQPGFQVTKIECMIATQRTTAGNLRFEYLPSMTFGKVKGGIMKLAGAHLAISSDEGKTWIFLSLKRGKGLDELKAFFPDGLGGITPPEKQAPIMIPSDEATPEPGSAKKE